MQGGAQDARRVQPGFEKENAQKTAQGAYADPQAGLLNLLLATNPESAFSPIDTTIANSGIASQWRNEIGRRGTATSVPPSRAAPPKALLTARDRKSMASAVEKLEHYESMNTESQPGALKPLCIGLSHKTASVDVREKMAIKEGDWNQAAAEIVQYDSIKEAAVLSTCNRFELYLAAEDMKAATEDLMEYLTKRSGLSDEELRPNMFFLEDQEATWHMLQVAAGLDSLVLGEQQILSQVKKCYKHARAPKSEDEPAGSAGRLLDRFLTMAISGGKLVRSETGISTGSVSISSAGVELAAIKVKGHLKRPLPSVNVACVGAGEMTRLLLIHLEKKGVMKVIIYNRSRDSAKKLAEQHPDMDIEIKLMDEFWDTMDDSDLIFTATSAVDPIITKELLMKTKYGDENLKKPLMLVDIAVPRNIEEECNEMPNVVGYNVDDLQQVVDAHREKRRQTIIQAEILLKSEMTHFRSFQHSMPYLPLISRVKGSFEELRKSELQDQIKSDKELKSLSPEQLEAVDRLTRSLMDKAAQRPSAYCARITHEQPKASVKQIEELFGIK